MNYWMSDDRAALYSTERNKQNKAFHSRFAARVIARLRPIPPLQTPISRLQTSVFRLRIRDFRAQKPGFSSAKPGFPPANSPFSSAILKIADAKPNFATAFPEIADAKPENEEAINAAKKGILPAISEVMKGTYILSASILLLLGCSRDDIRLHGTWHSNREASVAAAFQRDPRWTNAPLEKVERLKDVYGHMTLTYSNGKVTSTYRGETGSFPYRVVKRGADFVVIRTGGSAIDSGHDIRIEFVDGGAGYWSDSGPDAWTGASTREKFDRVSVAPAGEPSRP
jgi:hypothetical protein